MDYDVKFLICRMMYLVDVNIQVLCIYVCKKGDETC